MDSQLVSSVVNSKAVTYIVLTLCVVALITFVGSKIKNSDLSKYKSVFG